MAFKMKGFPLRSGFKQISDEEKKEIAENQDPGSGRNQIDEIKHDMKHAQEQIDEAKYNLKNNPHDPNGDKEEKEKYSRWMNQHNIKLSNLTRGLNMQKKDYLNYLSRKGMLPK